ncbi:hypothetical protein [Sorangium sp. So ce128]|uniref:hypothetical protein n=1 Tax=Sorangium sp. So ce128 TaxID=3133281 RepID=UPI003F61FF80
MKSGWTAAGMVVYGCLAGCGGAETPQGDWKQVLASLDGESATFSLSYRAEPPDGAIVRAAVHQGGIDAPCSLYSGSETTEGDFWYLSVTANSARSGAFNIVPQMSGGDGLPEHRDSALVRLIEVRGWEKRRVYTAISGTVTLADVPLDLEEWAEGRPMVMDISASFPDQPMQSLGCSGGGSGDGSMSVHQCQCGREDGTTVTCTSDVPGQDCCLRDAGSGAGPQVRLNAVTQQCPHMCSFTDPGLARHCRALKDGN